VGLVVHLSAACISTVYKTDEEAARTDLQLCSNWHLHAAPACFLLCALTLILTHEILVQAIRNIPCKISFLHDHPGETAQHVLVRKQHISVPAAAF